MITSFYRRSWEGGALYSTPFLHFYFLELKQFQGIEEQLQNNNMEQKAEKYGDNKNKWDNNL